MPDLPSPQDATEAALFSECWDAVLSYADLCTAGSTAAAELAREAFAQGIRELRAAEAGTARRSSRLPRIPLLLTAVRRTAAAWEDAGQGHKLDPGLRLWLHSDEAARYTGPPLERPVALRGLRDLQPADAELLWLAEAEALPLPLVARRLGLDPATAADELAQVSRLFRDRCHRNHLDSPMDAECRGYARLLDAVTRSPAADSPAGLSRHLTTCHRCAEAAACLRPRGGGLPGALAGGVIGWGGLAYLERRRRAAEARLGAGRPDRPDTDGGDPTDGGGGTRVARHALLVAAALVSLLALVVTLMPFDDTAGRSAARPDADRRPVADPGPSLPPAPSAHPTSPGSPKPSAERTPEPGNPEPAPQGTSSAAPETTGHSGPAACRADYDLVNQWPDGFQATVTVTTREPLDSWRVGFAFRDGQWIRQMWDASVSQNGSRVTAVAAEYNKEVPAGGTLAFGFLASWRGTNSPPYDVTLNGRPCVTV
ncbi:cellulose binding domain-containing protein [Streptomyces griseoloalbus]|uniref:Cellulose binding domain-containing protein n=1 Tax=Streptomyces griseoloalbus TaxID=67303 RepID=A0ABV3E7P8_9ACTN